MSYFSVIVPVQTTNLVTNPSIESATTGYTAVGGSIARSTSQARYGAASLAITPTSGTTDGAYFGTISTTNGQTYTLSVDVLGVLGVPYRIYFGSTAAAVLGTPTTFTGTGDWQRVEVTYTETSTTTRRLYLVKNSSASTGVFYADGWQCENLAYATTYCDGDQVGNRDDGYVWTGTRHASTSTRHAQERKGGRVQDMETDLGVTIVGDFTGGGAPDFRHNTEALALLPGELYQNSKVGPRFIDLKLTFNGATPAETLADRKTFYNAIKLNRVTPPQPFVFRFTGGAEPLEIDCFYAGGFEQKELKGQVEQTSIRLQCPQPYWRALGNGNKTLAIRSSLSNANYIVQRSALGVWSALGSGMNNIVHCMTVAPDGNLYAGGVFSTAGGTTVNGIAKWNGSAWSALGSTPGVAGGGAYVKAIAIGPDGAVYAGGAFTSAGGVAAGDYIAKYTPSTNTWSALGTGMNGEVHALAIGSDGTLYAGGDFTSAGGVANTNGIAKWNGSAWSSMNGSVLAGQLGAYALAVGLDGKIYAGGLFETIGGVGDTNGVAVWNPTTSTWSALGTGIDVINYAVLAMAVAPDGSLYAGGTFPSISGVTVNHIAKWNGSSWSDMGGGVDDNVYSLAVAPDGSLYAGGTFLAAGGVSLPDSVAKWNGSAWTQLIDLDLPGTPSVFAIAIHNGALTLGFSTSGTATVSSGNTVTHSGTAEAHPKLVVSGPGRIYSLINFTTGKAIHFDLSLNSGETVTLNLDPQHITFKSTFQGVIGNIIGKLLNGSNVADWVLQPGDNYVNLFSDNASTAAYLVWDELFESVDG